MEKLKFKMQGFWYNVWRLIYESDIKDSDIPPEDTCSYRWELILSSFILLSTLPITIYRVIYLRVVKAFDLDWYITPGILGHMIPSIFFIIFSVSGIYFAEQDNILQSYKWYYIIYGAFITIGTTGLIYSVIIAGEWVRDKIADIKFSKSKTTKPLGTVGTLYKGWKDNHCSPIEWEK